jgi:hypothetical protein
VQHRELHTTIAIMSTQLRVVDTDDSTTAAHTSPGHF